MSTELAATRIPLPEAVPALKRMGASAATFLGRYGLLILTLALLATVAAASGSGDSGDGGTGATTVAAFDGVYGWLKGLIGGTGGKLIALSAFVVGICMGVLKQSIAAFAIGCVFALVLVYGPVVIEQIFAFAI